MTAPLTSNDRFFEIQPTPIVVLRLDGCIAHMNPAWESMTGLASAKLAGRPLVEVLHPADRETVGALLQAFRRRFEQNFDETAGNAGESGADEALLFEARLVRGDGAVRWLEWSAVASAREGLLRALVNDVTARHEASEKERFLRTLLSNLPGMVYRCRNDARTWTMEFVSAGCRTVTGYAPEDLLGDSMIAYADLIHPDDQAYVAEQVEAAVTAGASFLLQYRIRTSTGQEKWVYEQGRGVFLPEGEFVALEGVILDITERVLAEQVLQEKLSVIQAQQEAIRSLSIPIIEVWEGVLTLPVVGVVDANRAVEMTQALLEAVVRSRCRYAIVDLTAVGSMDAEIASHLVTIIQAVELLGARGIIVGIQPAVARVLVEIGVDLSRILTRSNLRDALSLCMRGVA